MASGRTFQMGARMTLKDQFKSAISNITRSTQTFKQTVDNANRSTGTFTDKLGRLHDATGKYVAKGNEATLRTRAWIGSNGKLGASLGIVQKGLAGLVMYFGLAKAKNWLIDGNADMETYQNTLAVVLKDQKKAADMLSWATKFAAKTPFEIPGVVEATTRLQTYGIQAQKTLPIIGDMASVMGKDLMQAVEAVADAQTGELERLKEFGITKAQIQEQAKAMKLTVINNKGQITDQKAFNATLFALMEKRYKGGMDLQSKSFKGMLSNFNDFVGSVGRTLGKPIFDAAKTGLGDMLAWLNKIQASGAIDNLAKKVGDFAATAGRVFGYVKTYVVQVIQTIVNKVRAWYADNKPKIDSIGTAFRTAFKTLADIAMPIIAWLKDTALPGVIDALGKVGTWVLNVANWFISNWGTIGPLVYGIAAAWGAYFAITKTIQVATKVWTAVQWALNAAMNANPVGLIVTAIGLLIGVIILVVTHWEQVKTVFFAVCQAIANFFIGIWNWIKTTVINIFNAIVGFFKKWGLTILAVIMGPIGILALLVYKNFDKIKLFVSNVAEGIKSAFASVGGFIKKVFDGLVSIVKAPINFLIKAINTVLRGVNKVNIKVPDWVPMVGGKQIGFNIPEIPFLAKGTKNWKGGPAYMNERGGELAILPGGSQVIPADKTDKVLDKPKKSLIIKQLVGQLILQQQPGEDAETFADRVVTVMYEKLSKAAEIANTDEMGALVGE